MVSGENLHDIEVRFQGIHRETGMDGKDHKGLAYCQCVNPLGIRGNDAVLLGDRPDVRVRNDPSPLVAFAKIENAPETRPAFLPRHGVPRQMNRTAMNDDLTALSVLRDDRTGDPKRNVFGRTHAEIELHHIVVDIVPRSDFIDPIECF